MQIVTKMHFYFLLTFYFVQVASFSIGKVKDVIEINEVNEVKDITKDNNWKEVNDVTLVDDDVAPVNDIFKGIKVNDLSKHILMCFDASHVFTSFYIWNCPLLPAKVNKTKANVIVSLEKTKQCKCTHNTHNTYITHTHDTHNVTREIMRNAMTREPGIPYLMNVSSKPRFSIYFPPFGISYFEDGFLLDFPNLFALFILQNPLQRIRAKMFEGVERLRHLDLTDCSLLSEIEDGAFENMTLLQFLRLTETELTKLNATTFQNMVSLTKLQLNYNAISHIHKDSFMDLSKLVFLDLSGNYITALHLDTFKKQTRLKTLLLSNNEIQSLSSEIFKNLINLEEIFLDQNPLSNIPSGMFNHSSVLVKIFLGCTTADITANIYNKKANMTIEKGGLSTKSFMKMILIMGCLNDLKPSAFEGVYTEYLELWHNEQLTKISHYIFNGMRKILNLKIVMNSIDTIEYDSFQDDTFTDLLTLNISTNYLETVPDGSLSKMRQLKSLDLSNNFITTISPQIFADLMSLTNLDLRFNRISHIQGDAFSSLVLLKTLNLGHNQISNLSSISFQGLRSLISLDLSSNKLKTIAYTDFDDMLNTMDSIILRQNQIKKIEGFHRPIVVDVFDLSNNDLLDLHDSFRSEGRMIILKLMLSENRITRIDYGDLSVIQQMKELFLDRNQIRDVSFINYLQTVPERLDISHNNITEVSSAMGKMLQRINYLTITQNPWKCSCEANDRDLMQFLLNQSIISCCPNLCQCSKNADRSIFMNCNSQNQSSLPSCLPFEQVKLDYSNNIIGNLSFIKDQENVSFLDVSQNLITSINGSSLNILKKVTVLKLDSNLLHKLPEDVRQMSSTKIYIKGNYFFCDDCSLVNILQTVTQSVPQNITCAKNQFFYKESFICLVKYTIAPYSFLSFACVVLIIMVYALVKLVYIKRLKKIYKQKTVILSSKELTKAYKQECALLREIDHQNIIKMYTNLTTWVPFVKNIGHLFLEKVDYSLSEVISQTVILAFPLNVHSLTVDLLSAIHYLHSKEYPICHGQLGTNTVYLLQDIASETNILKIGDLSLAKRFFPLSSADKSIPLASSSDDQTRYIHADLQAVAKIIYALLTNKERDEIVMKEEIMQLSEIEFGILILALQNGMNAKEALQAAPYHSAEQKKSILGELNAYLKMIKNAKKSAEILLEAEENACLVMGGKGAWNKHFDLIVMEDFALHFNGYNITSFIDLLRLIRNMLEHGHECPRSMEAAFKTSKPTPEKMFLEFSRKFPYFYLHCLLCYYTLFKERSHSVSEIFMTTYRSFEKSLCEDLLIRGSLLPLQEKSCLTIHFKSISDNFKVTLMQDHTRSCIAINDVFPEIFLKITEIWDDVPVAEIIFKYHKKFVQNPYSNASSPTPEYALTSKMFVPEGSTIEVLKPEIKVQLPHEVISMVFKPTDNVKAIKGLAMKHLTPALRKKVKPETVSITVNDNPLKDKDKLVDFVNVTLTVKYPHVDI